ncbi:MAG: hypothetical protein GX444_20815 [Myxococcales bacterium]|nr:hypothetical protein [Myxococcales bacterium]
MARKGSNKGAENPPKKAEGIPETAPEKQGKNGKAARKPGEKEAATKKPKRGIAATTELPSLVVPGTVWLVLLLLGYLLASYDHYLFKVELDSSLEIVVGLATLLLFVGGPIYRNYRQLTRPVAKGIILGGGALTILICAASVYFAANFGEPIGSGIIAAGATDSKKVEIQLPGTHYRLFLRGHFPEIDKKQKEMEEAANKGKKGADKMLGSYKLSGAYALQLRSADGQSIIDNYNGKFEQERSMRRLSKRGRGYLEVMRTMTLNDLDVKHPGTYTLQVVSLGENLEQKLEYAIYRDRQYPWTLAVIGLVVVFWFGLVDLLIKPLRVDSYFAACAGFSFGFIAYFNSTTIPNSLFSTLGVSLIIGGFIGAGTAYLVFLAAKKLYTPLIRRWQLNLS